MVILQRSAADRHRLQPDEPADRSEQPLELRFADERADRVQGERTEHRAERGRRDGRHEREPAFVHVETGEQQDRGERVVGLGEGHGSH